MCYLLLGTYYLFAVAVSSSVLHSLCYLICLLFVCVKCEVRSLPVHHRGEETDLGTSRSLTRLPFVPRNTVGRGRTEPRIIDSRSVFYILCSLLHDICIRYVLAG